MTKPNPFSYIKNLNMKREYDYELSGYVPFLTNRSFAMHVDTLMLSEEMNQYHQLSPQLQYDFYFHGVRQGKRFAKFPKPVDPPNLDVVMEYFNYSKDKAIAALKLLTKDDLKNITKSLDRGGK